MSREKRIDRAVRATLNAWGITVPKRLLLGYWERELRGDDAYGLAAYLVPVIRENFAR